MQTEKKANSQNNSKAQAGAAQPQAAKRPTDILKEHNKQLDEKAQWRAYHIEELLDVIDEYMEMNTPRTCVSTLCTLLEEKVREEMRENDPDMVSLNDLVMNVSGMVQLLAGIHHHYPQIK
jgi:hypothetical protein